ncbi:hypothetical protein JCM6882_003663, partial [Rhodosporidiobolus microsporus]
NLNFAFAVFTFVTLAGVVSWWVVPEEMWLSRRAVGRILESAAAPRGATGACHQDSQETEAVSTATEGAGKQQPVAAVH